MLGCLFENGRPFPEYYPIVQNLSDVDLYVFMVNTSFKLRTESNMSLDYQGHEFNSLM